MVIYKKKIKEKEVVRATLSQSVSLKIELLFYWPFFLVRNYPYPLVDCDNL